MILINGVADDRLSVHDRSIHYGDGLFETIAVKNGTPLCWDQHMRRLVEGCRRLSLPPPAESLLARESTLLCNGQSRAVLKIILTRGSGGRGYQPPPESHTTRIIGLYDWPQYPVEFSSKGISAAICNFRLGHNPRLAGIKHLNRLEQVLLRHELAATGLQEGVVLDLEDHVIEGTMSNLFCIYDKTLVTPALDRCGVAGIVRQEILTHMESRGWQIRVTELTLEALLDADEIFFCNSIIGVWPVCHLADREYPEPEKSYEIIRYLQTGSVIA